MKFFKINTMGWLIFIFGLIFGSFVNVCIYRLPKGKSIVTPGSFCPKCKRSILWYDNIPLLSYIFLGGKCRYCKEKISPRYFMVELLTGFLFLILYVKFNLQSVFFIYLLLVLSLIIVSFIDLETFLIPDIIVIPGIFLGLLFSVLSPDVFGEMGRKASFLYSLTGAILGAAIPFFLGVVGKMIYKKDAMGGGDVKLLAMIGAFLGWRSVLVSMFFGSLLGTVVSLTLIGLKLKKMDDYVPFGPYLSAGAIIALFWKGYPFLGFLIP